MNHFPYTLSQLKPKHIGSFSSDYNDSHMATKMPFRLNDPKSQEGSTFVNPMGTHNGTHNGTRFQQFENTAKKQQQRETPWSRLAKNKKPERSQWFNVMNNSKMMAQLTQEQSLFQSTARERKSTEDFYEVPQNLQIHSVKLFDPNMTANQQTQIALNDNPLSAKKTKPKAPNNVKFVIKSYDFGQHPS